MVRSNHPAALLIALLLLLAGCTDDPGDNATGTDDDTNMDDDATGDGNTTADGNMPNDDNTTDDDETTDDPAPEPRVPQQHNVTTAGNNFDPESITIVLGDTVEWTISGGVAHTVTADDADQWGTTGNDADGNAFMTDGDTWDWTPTEAGTYTYHCALHSTQTGGGAWQGMVGTVTVTDDEAEA